MAENLKLHGLTLSYFTGKLEAYLRVKGIAYDFVEMDMRDFRRCAAATGIAQMPQLEFADGRWLTDTTAIIRHFEAQARTPALSPDDPVTRFISRLLEDYGDEALWRPALYYRWAFREDYRLMSSQIARTMLRDLRAPFWLRRQFILRRQRKVFLREDGVTAATAPQIEAQYHRTLDVLEAILSHRPFLMGERPVEADFGFFGSMFRHFSHDPTPAGIMRARAPHVLLWVARLWACGPQQAAAAPLPEHVPEDLGPLLREVTDRYLPYLERNRQAYSQDQATLHYEEDGVAWALPVNPYRVQCLADLSAEFSALTAEERGALRSLLGEACNIFEITTTGPQVPAPGDSIADRQWRR